MRRIVQVLVMSLIVIGVLSGCQHKDADEVVTEQLEAKSESEAYFQEVLEDGIADEDEEYRIGFPKEAEEAYSSFLQDLSEKATYQVGDVKESADDKRQVEVTVIPVDVAATFGKVNTHYAMSMSNNDFGAAIEDVVKLDTQELDTPVKGKEKKVTVTLTKKKGEWNLSNKEMKKITNAALDDYMAPYESVAKAYNTRACLQAYLDLGLKGDSTLYQQFFPETEDEVLEEYDTIYNGEELFRNLQLSDEQKEQGQAAIKKIYQNTDYTLGAPSVDEKGNCTIPVTVRPNTCLPEIEKAVEANVEKGVYANISQIGSGALELLEQYADEPTYGDQREVTVKVNYEDAMKQTGDNSWWTDLEEQIVMPAVS